MNITTFIGQLENEFEELKPGTLQQNTSFKDLDEWSSMYALIIIALIDTEYDVVLTGEDLSSISTVEELYNIVESRIE